MWPDGGHVLCDWYVEVPYVKAETSDITPSVVAGDNAVATAAKGIVNNKFAYLQTVAADAFEHGSFIASDLTGNYKIQNDTKTVQTVGKLLGIDNRFPKAMLDEVQTYPGSRMPGTQTAGLPSFLFEFVQACETLKTSGSAPTIEATLNLVRAGTYGIARIQLSVA